MERKVKYDYTFKLECIKLVLEQHYSCTYVANQRGLNKSNIRKWVGFYKEYGALGLLAKKNQSYSVPFKLKVLKSIDKDLMSLRDVSIKFNIPDTGIIVKWKKYFANFGLVALQPKPRGRPKSMNTNKRKKRKSDKPLTREEELLLEIEALRCENELLKKLQALIQAEERTIKRKP
ncbi:transposase [Flavobacterium sp. LB2P6]|uniref:transposase n=1 Tax=Flavobacterium sp. LB2P6 TaxID=3401714 RepID=UPI003AAF5098